MCVHSGYCVVDAFGFTAITQWPTHRQPHRLAQCESGPTETATELRAEGLFRVIVESHHNQCDDHYDLAVVDNYIHTA